MNNDLAPRSPRAVTAIAAVLALSAIPAATAVSAQEAAAPSLSLPQDVTVGTPAQSAQPTVTPATPVVTLPPEAIAPANPVGESAAPSATAATPTQPVVAPETTPAAQTETAAEPAARTARRAAAPRTLPVAGPAPSVPTAQASSTEADSVLAEGSVPPAATAPVRADPAPQPAAPVPVAAQDSGDLPVAGIVGLLAALGVAGIGIATMRRRRTHGTEEADYETETLPSADIAEPVPVAVPFIEASPIAAAAPLAVTPVAAPRAAGPAPASSATAVLASAPLPHSADERRALLDRMVEAEPDEDNPFTSRKSRMRRARVQLQHHEHVEEARMAQVNTFDFRNYKPSTRNGGAPVNPVRPDLIDA